VKIRQLTVPSTVEAGSENILLDCDFDYDADERVQLDIKWYFNNEPSPFYTWVPEKMSRPQIIGKNLWIKGLLKILLYLFYFLDIIGTEILTFQYYFNQSSGFWTSPNVSTTSLG
jgi:hypothetical protein